MKHEFSKFTAISRKVAEKVHATIPKGIMGGFEPAQYVKCRRLFLELNS